MIFSFTLKSLRVIEVCPCTSNSYVQMVEIKIMTKFNAKKKNGTNNHKKRSLFSTL